MKIDKSGEIVLTQSELHDLYMIDPDRHIASAQLADYSPPPYTLDGVGVPLLTQWVENDTVTDHDLKLQSRWRMPSEYQTLDIVGWVIEQCSTQVQLERVAQELVLYQDHDALDLLRYLKYLVDTMRQQGHIWGVGRGSSVASYVLFLIGVHRIDSLKYDLSITEFFK